MTDPRLPVRRALLSVSDKTGLLELARALVGRGIELIPTGGTARVLREAGLKVTEVSEVTGFPEIMHGRVKTLHPKIHAALLGRAGLDEGVMAEHEIEPIDLLVLNLYPFEQVVARQGCSLSEAIENIDIGGPAMLRAAGKNFSRVAVLSDPAQYAEVLAELDGNDGTLGADTRFRLAVAAFERVARYDEAISDYLSGVDGSGVSRSTFPERLHLSYVKAQDLRYGENPHQLAAFYRDPTPAAGTLASFRLLQGKALSYNNLADLDAAWECVRELPAPACVIVKHANPCGVAMAEAIGPAYERAYRTDPTSAFGGIVAFNRPLDGATARALLERQFVEAIAAPSIDAEARVEIARKPNIRAIEIPPGAGDDAALDLRRVGGGLLAQTVDRVVLDRERVKVVTRRAPRAAGWGAVLVGWSVVRHVKSNAIVYARHGATVGIGAGQTSRVMSARIAGLKAEEAGLPVAGSAMASDAFFPFRDGIDAAAAAGARAVIQPGGSMRDQEVVAAADEHGMAMVFTGNRHFRH